MSGNVANKFTMEESQSTSKPDIRAIMAEIRERVRKDIATNSTKRPAFVPSSPEQHSQATRKAGELLHSEELRFLNSNYSFSTQLKTDTVTSHRPGIIGKVIVAAKRKLLRIIWDSLLRDYFVAEKDFNSNVVRFLNDVSKYVDARDASNFWEIIRKIDYDVTKATERIERIADEQSASTYASERRVIEELNRGMKEMTQLITELQARSGQHSAQLQTLDSVARGLEGALSLRGLEKPTTVATENAVTPKTPDVSYLLLENRYRGSQEDIANRLRIYPPIFASLSPTLPVLEIGAGRGELQRLFAQHAVPSYGIDLDAAMVETAKAGGSNVQYGDGIAHLEQCASKSLSGVIAIQVVEHLTQSQLKHLFALCCEKVASGGLILFETINPQSVTALSSNYFRDPTHVWPLHPDTLSYAMTLSGLEIVEIKYLSPVPQEAQLREVPTQEFMTPRWIETVELFNLNIKQLNTLLYGYQDYCVIARVR